MEPLALFLAVLKAGVLSVGGLSSLPLLRQELVSTGFVSEAQVLEALAIGRLSPGPNGLYVVGLGYFALGWLGAALALVATAIPPVSLVALRPLIRRYLVTPWAAGIVRGIALSTSALVLATGIELAAPGLNFLAVPPWQLALAASAAIIGRDRVHPGLLVVAGALIGIVVGALGG
jgi:chromate transporter